MILARPESEFRLEEEFVPRHEAALDRCRHGLSNRGLVVMAALVGGINTAETLRRASSARRGVSSSFQAVPYRKRGTECR